MNDGRSTNTATFTKITDAVVTEYPCGTCGHAKADHVMTYCAKCQCQEWTPKKRVEPVSEADQLRAAIAEQGRLAAEVEQLRAAIAEHHHQHGDDRCWMDDEKLYDAADLPPGDHRVGDKIAMLHNCERFIANRCESGGPWKSYAELEVENERLTQKYAGAMAEMDALKTKIDGVHSSRTLGASVVALLKERDNLIEFIALARNAFEIMLRRGWSPKRSSDGGWYVWNWRFSDCVIRAADPFSALVAADKWWMENMEDKP